MTREEIEQLNGFEPYCIETDREQSWYEFGLVQGLETADTNPKSPWISVKDDLPCNHEKMVNNTCGLNNTPIRETDHVLVKYKKGFYDIKYMIKIRDKWKWYKPYLDIEYWMPIPELPKE